MKEGAGFAIASMVSCLFCFIFVNVTMTNFRKRHNCRKMKQSEFGYERLLNCDVTITSLKQFIQSN